MYFFLFFITKTTHLYCSKNFQNYCNSLFVRLPMFCMANKTRIEKTSWNKETTFVFLNQCSVKEPRGVWAKIQFSIQKQTMKNLTKVFFKNISTFSHKLDSESFVHSVTHIRLIRFTTFKGVTYINQLFSTLCMEIFDAFMHWLNQNQILISLSDHNLQKKSLNSSQHGSEVSCYPIMWPQNHPLLFSMFLSESNFFIFFFNFWIFKSH